MREEKRAMCYRSDYTRLGDLEVEGTLVLGDESVRDAAVTAPDAVFTPGAPPGAEEFRACVELCNAVKTALNDLIAAIT